MDDRELRAIGAAGEGFVADPSNRWWHVAMCPRILDMTVGQPKWFAPTRESLDVYLKQRRAEDRMAKPIRPCETCVSAAHRTSPLAAVGTLRAADDLVVRPGVEAPHIGRSNGRFDVWADEYVRNESKAASSACVLRRLITDEFRRLPEPAGRVLHALYAGERWPGTDVENLLFNNIDQTLGLFRRASVAGVRFEDLGQVAPAPPDGAARGTYYSYRLSETGAFEAVRAAQLICHVPEVVVPDSPARLAARVWLAVRQARPKHSDDTTGWLGDFALKIGVRGLNPGETVKALVDGATAAMQRDDVDRLRPAITRLSGLLEVDEGTLTDLTTGPDAPLGTRSRTKPNSNECLFTLDGVRQVRVTPNDDRCLGAEVLARPNDGPPRLTVDVYTATSR